MKLRTVLVYALALAVSVVCGSLLAAMRRGAVMDATGRPLSSLTQRPPKGPAVMVSAGKPAASHVEEEFGNPSASRDSTAPRDRASAQPATTIGVSSSSSAVRGTVVGADDVDVDADRLVESHKHLVLPRVWKPVDATANAARPIATELVRCANVGMQEKCLFRNIAVRRGTFISCGAKGASSGFPNPIYLPDGQKQPLIQYHKYRGHRIRVDATPCACRRVVPADHPVVFTFRMSGHSTYHLWENNLGPFYATLQEFPEVKQPANDRHKLLVAFADDKPVSGPKAPHLLDQLLRTFSDYPLINASLVADDDDDGDERPVCFERAILGTSANSFPHMALLHQMMRNIVGYAPPPPLPAQPRVLFISRNHKSVIRGRKIANEDGIVRAINATVLELTGEPLQFIQMETLKYREQVALAMQTNIMISPHGGGVANCIWMAKGSVMVEFVAPVGKTLLNMYHSMCGKSGVKHISFLADPDPADAKVQLSNPRLFSNMVVPEEKILDHVRKAVDHFRAARAKQPPAPRDGGRR